MKIGVPLNKNYCAIVTALDQFVSLPNCDNVKSALIFGNSVIVSKNATAGDVGVFFPVETQLDAEFCGANNLFRKPEWGNSDPLQKGFFEEHGRVKAVKFRGHKSEGFWIPISCLSYVGAEDLPVGTEFDYINGKPICKKYVPKTNRIPGVPGKQGRMARAEDKIVDGQFRFHIDTENLRRNSHKLEPNTWISISEKWHGASGVWANVLVKRNLNWFERVLKRVGVQISESRYGLVWSSRHVVKGVDGEAKSNAEHFYTSDIWGVVAREIEARVPKGYTLYGEIVGFTPDGAAIQKGYHYGCGPNEHRLVIYRATVTNPDGKMLELSWQQLKDFCAKYGFEMVKELWHGRAADLCPGFTGAESWHNYMVRFIEENWVKDEMCFYNNREVPAEGVVVKIDRLEEDEAYKLKSFKFLEWETKSLDKGESDMETQESEALPE